MSEKKKKVETDSTTEELEEETSAVVDPKYKRLALANVASGYVLAAALIALVAFNKPEVSEEGQQADAEEPDGLFVETDEITSANEVADPEKPVIELTQGDRITVPLGGTFVDPGYTAKSKDGFDLTAQVTVSGAEKINTLVPGVSYPIDYAVTDSDGNTNIATRYVFVVDNRFAHDNSVGIDRGVGVVLDDDLDIAVIDNPDYVVGDRDLRVRGDYGNDVRGSGIGGIGRGGRGGRDLDVVGRRGIGDDDGVVVDLGALDRALDEELVVIREEERYDVDDRADRNFRGLDVDRRRDANDVDFDADVGDFDKDAEGAGDGLGVDKGGKLYAYETPTLGVGAGIGAPAIGAGVGAAGIGAGIGEAVLDGKPVPALGGTGTYAPPAGAPAGPDGDGDAIPDALESAFRTNPNKADSDGDGFSDADEVKGLSNPNDPRSKPGATAPTGEADEDGDGLPTSVEKAYGTNPQLADTDGDGFNDGQELSSMTVPTDAKSNPGAPGIGGPAMAMGPGAAGGVGGLVSGAGTGGAAGLVSGMVKQPLGLGIGCESCGDKGCGKCAGSHPEGCACGHCGGGHHGGDHDFDKRHWEDLPPDGNLYIMMHVDGSGSILETRKALEEMRDTIMKNALLPYYLNDENLYDRRVLVVDGNGERTLQFYKDATKKDNVLAFAFQDEAQPVYHMPNFNKEPEEKYIEDLNGLKRGLGGYGGLYRGVMFQVDRGKTHAKSFKEFVENAWRGEGYLSGSNLKKYYWEENRHHIKNHDGVVFSDVYHVKDDADPQYYMNLIFESARKVGIDLQKYGGGLDDGNYNSKTQQD